MATTTSLPPNPSRASFLTVTPINFSLTEGTSIPAPPVSPPQTPTKDPHYPLARPPTSGGGPLSSHPTTPDHKTSGSKSHPPFALPTSPSSNYMSSPERNDMPPPPPHTRRPSGVRRLFSLNNLRSSFSSSRTSLSLADTRPPTSAGAKRPSSPSITSSRGSSSQMQRPGSSAGANGTVVGTRTKRSGSWFKRKSMLFLGGQGEELDSVPEGGEVKNKKMKGGEGLPVLPEVSALGGGLRLDGGDIGWDEGLFRR